MLTFGNERIIQQGEDWNLDIKLSQSYQEYIPFIISGERQNPMFILRVASTKYEKVNRYIVTWWLGTDHIPKFYQTVPQYIGEIVEGGVISRPFEDRPFEALYQYTKESDEVDIKLGHKPYHYVYFDEHNDPHFDYECKIILQIPSEETAKWNSQNYVYQISLADTIAMTDYIQEFKNLYPELDWPITNDTEILYNFIEQHDPQWFQDDIDATSPVGKVDNIQVILPPTRLQVDINTKHIT